MEITFEQLPKAVTQLCVDIAFIKQHLLEKSAAKEKPAADRWFNLSELCDYLPDKPAKATVYAQVSANSIPYHKGSKKLSFLKSEIDNWLKQGGKQTIAEIAADRDKYLSTKKTR